VSTQGSAARGRGGGDGPARSSQCLAGPVSPRRAAGDAAPRGRRPPGSAPGSGGRKGPGGGVPHPPPSGPYQPVTRLEIARALARRKARRARQHEYLTILGEDPELAQLRADRLRNIAEVARILARYASWVDSTTRPTRALICRLAGISLSTWKAARRWLEQHAYLGTVRQGRTPMLQAGVLTDQDAPNEAAIYVLCVPRNKPGPERPVPPEQVTRPLPGPERSEGHGDPAPAREKSRIAPLQRGPGSKLSDEHVTAIARPFLAAGWSPADLQHALEHQPDGRQHRTRLENVRSPAHWLAWRLSRWCTEPDVAWQAYRELGRWARLPAPVPVASWSMRAWHGVTPIGHTYLAANRARAAAARRADPHPIARALRERMGWAQPKEQPS
jgi:hypothetical protein